MKMEDLRETLSPVILLYCEVDLHHPQFLPHISAVVISYFPINTLQYQVYSIFAVLKQGLHDSSCLSVFENESLISQIKKLIFMKINVYVSVEYFSQLFITSFLREKKNSSCFFAGNLSTHPLPSKTKEAR